MAMMFVSPLTPSAPAPAPGPTGDNGPLGPTQPPGNGLGEFGRELQRQTAAPTNDPQALPGEPVVAGKPAGGHRRLADPPQYGQVPGAPADPGGESVPTDPADDPISLAPSAEADDDAQEAPDDIVALTLAMTAWPPSAPTTTTAPGGAQGAAAAASDPSAKGRATAGGNAAVAACAAGMGANEAAVAASAGPVVGSVMSPLPLAARPTANPGNTGTGTGANAPAALPTGPATDTESALQPVGKPPQGQDGVSFNPLPARATTAATPEPAPAQTPASAPKPTATTAPALTLAPASGPALANNHAAQQAAAPVVPASTIAAVTSSAADAASSSPRTEPGSKLDSPAAPAANATPVSGPQFAPIELRSTALPAPVEAQVRATVASPEFAPALGAQISLLAREGVQEARIQLHPAEMGPISVQIALDGSAARVDFHASVAATRNAIEASLPALATALQDAGFTLAGGGVFQQGAQQQQAQAQQQQAAAQDGRATGNGGRVSATGSGPAVDGAASRVIRTQRGLVDLIA